MYRIDMLINTKEGWFITLPDLYEERNKAYETALKEAKETGCICRIRKIATYPEIKKF